MLSLPIDTVLELQKLDAPHVVDAIVALPAQETPLSNVTILPPLKTVPKVRITPHFTLLRNNPYGIEITAKPRFKHGELIRQLPVCSGRNLDSTRSTSERDDQEPRKAA